MSIGRNGEFEPWLMEDVYWRTLVKIRAWLAGQAITSRQFERSPR